MTDLLTRAWHALTPEQRPVGMTLEPGGLWRDDGESWLSDAAAYDRLCVACEMVLFRAGCVPSFRSKGEWGADGANDGDKWEWYFYSESVAHTCRLTAAVLAIEATKGGDDER